jgi:hypothetical protein
LRKALAEHHSRARGLSPPMEFTTLGKMEPHVAQEAAHKTMDENLLDIGKVFGVSSAGLATASFGGLDAFLNSGILAVTFLYALCKFAAFVLDRMRKKDKKDKTERKKNGIK